MAKKILITTLAILTLAGAGFASGQKEPVQSPAQAAPFTAAPTGEKLSLTGTLSLEGSMHPILKAAGKEYELMVPRYLTWNLEVKEGEQVSVEGYVVQGMPRRANSDDGDIDLMVTKATIKGKDYDLSQSRGQGRGAMMGRGGAECDGCWAAAPRGSRGSGWNRGGGRGRGEMRPGWGRGFQS